MPIQQGFASPDDHDNGDGADDAADADDEEWEDEDCAVIDDDEPLGALKTKKKKKKKKNSIPLLSTPPTSRLPHIRSSLQLMKEQSVLPLTYRWVTTPALPEPISWAQSLMFHRVRLTMSPAFRKKYLVACMWDVDFEGRAHDNHVKAVEKAEYLVEKTKRDPPRRGWEAHRVLHPSPLRHTIINPDNM